RPGALQEMHGAAAIRRGDRRQRPACVYLRYRGLELQAERAAGGLHTQPAPMLLGIPEPARAQCQRVPEPAGRIARHRSAILPTRPDAHVAYFALALRSRRGRVGGGFTGALSPGAAPGLARRGDADLSISADPAAGPAD